MFRREKDPQPNLETQISLELQGMFDTYWNFYKTARVGEDSTLLASIDHNDIENITENENVHTLLVYTGMVRMDAPTYFEVEPTRTVNIPGILVHNRVIGRGKTASDLDFTIASAVIIHEDTATETIYLKLGSISAEDEAKISAIEANWQKVLSEENGRFGSDPFPVDLAMANALRVARALNLKGGTVLDLKPSDLN